MKLHLMSRGWLRLLLLLLLLLLLQLQLMILGSCEQGLLRRRRASRRPGCQQGGSRRRRDGRHRRMRPAGAAYAMRMGIMRRL